MSLATILTDIAPIYERPSAGSARADEVLYGMSVQVIQESDTGWCYLRAEHGTEGYTPLSYLERNAEVAASWRKYRKMTVLAPYVDVQKAAAGNSARIASLPRGGVLVPLAREDDNGWMKVGLANGDVGFTRGSYLGDVIEDWQEMAEEDMRWNIVETALSYNGAAYRMGGRSPLGIDSVGLCAMSYLMNGVDIPRTPFLRKGGALGSVSVDKVGEGDVIYFSDGMGIYIGNGQFVHASEIPGSEGVAVNSLRPRDKDYREDLAEHIVAVGSLY